MDARRTRGLTLAAGALLVGVLADPSGRATAGGGAEVRGAGSPVPQSSAVTVQRYRLVTGDTVRVLTAADGVRIPRVEGRTPFIWSGGPGALTVVPRTAAARLTAFDPSLFDIDALTRATRQGRTPIVVRFAGTAVHAAPVGLRLAPGTPRRTGRDTVVHASFGPHFPGFDQSELRNIASIRLDRPRTRVTARATTTPTHTVRFHVTAKDGTAAEYAMVTVQNTVDGSSYLEQADVNGKGVATFTDVPEGEYSAVIQTFEAVLVDRQFTLTSDRTVEMNLGDATVKPHVTLPDHRPVWTNVTVERAPEQGFAIPFGSAGPHFDMRVQPTPGKVRHGALHTGVTATMVRGRRADGYDDVALTADVARGVPDDLTFAHHRREFARTTDVFYGNGPAAKRTLMLVPGHTHADVSLGETDLAVPIPGRFHLWVQAGPGSYAQQTLFPLATVGAYDDYTQIGDVRRYRTPGRRPPLTFLHGPVGPGLELAPDSPYSSGAVRRGNKLQFFVPVLSTPGLHTFDFVDPHVASWTLRRGRDILAHGHAIIAASVVVPAGRRTYRLSAHTHPGKAWDLSTHVDDLWTFHSRAGRSGVPLLTPRYRPPTDLAGALKPGPTGFRLTFHSTPHSARVAHASMELSTDDGRTWRPARVTRTSALTFHVGYRNPSAHGAVRYVSLRLTADDIHGNTTRETVIHAYRLR